LQVDLTGDDEVDLHQPIDPKSRRRKEAVLKAKAKANPKAKAKPPKATANPKATAKPAMGELRGRPAQKTPFRVLLKRVYSSAYHKSPGLAAAKRAAGQAAAAEFSVRSAEH
jgi:hypothetical protein